MSLAQLLAPFRSCFTARTFVTFTMLVAGLIAAPARRTVCGMLTATRMSTVWHHSRAHRFFAATRWSLDHVGVVMLGLIIVAEHRERARWYTTKTHPSYRDMLVKLRRVLIATQYRADLPGDPTPEQICAIHLAWADAAA